MKTLLGILILTAMIFTLNSLAVAADLMTPLAYGNGFNCVAYNMGNKKVEIEIEYCKDENTDNMYCYEHDPKIVAPGEKIDLGVHPLCLRGCYAICYFSFKGGADKVSAGLENRTFAGDVVLIPAE